MFKPHAWQSAAKAAAIDFFASSTEGKGAMIVAPTGAGKTKCGHYILQDVWANGGRTLWIAAQEELILQPIRSMTETWPGVSTGIVQSKKDEYWAQAVFASKLTIIRPGRLDAILKQGVPDIVVVDEAHESVSAGYRRLMAQLREAGSRFIGFTATPERNDKENLSDLWEIIYRYSLLEALADKVVLPPYVAKFLVPGLDLHRVKLARGDYSTNDLDRELRRAHIVQHTVKALTVLHSASRQPFDDHTVPIHPAGLPTLVHTCTIAQAEETAAALTEAGFVAWVVHSKMKKAHRRRALASFLNGTVQILCSPAALGQGVDLPLAVINVIARPTRSRRLYIQMTGRVLRPFGDKELGLNLDLCGASDIHSLISAPVLVDGTDCRKAADGHHIYLEGEDGSGVCKCCARKIKCYRNRGSHDFLHGKCRLCGAHQCADSPSKEHEYIPWDNGEQLCCHCGIKIRDPLAGMMNRYYPPREPVLWTTIDGLPGEVEAADLGGSGILFNVKRGDLYMPMLYTRRKLHKLAVTAVPIEVSHMLTDDVARQSKRVQGQFGGFVSSTAKRWAIVQLDDLARKLKVWEEE